MILECVVVGFVQTNCYILAAKFAQSAVIIDPGDEEPKIRAVLSRHKLRAGLVILTHGHFDHIGSAHKFSVPVYIHNRERDFLNDPNLNLSGFAGISFTLKADVRGVKDKDIISLEGIELQVIDMPGHTPGGMALLMRKPQDNILFTGDSLFYQGVGRTDFPYGDEHQLINSIKKGIFGLGDGIRFYPGHGPDSTIGAEKKNNSFLA